jgi:hypothetical protein
MSDTTRDAVQFAPHTAFVVQLTENPEMTSASLAGRVEHVVSGRAGHFASATELGAFMAKTLKDLEEERARDA